MATPCNPRVREPQLPVQEILFRGERGPAFTVGRPHSGNNVQLLIVVSVYVLFYLLLLSFVHCSRLYGEL